MLNRCLTFLYPYLARVGRRILRFILLAVLGLAVTINLPALSQQSPTTTAPTLLQQGIDHYEAEQFSEAATLWQQAASAFATQDDTLSQALALSNLSLAYQHLGYWEEADEAITGSLSLLQTPEATANPQLSAEILAKALNTQGRLQWVRGQHQEAFATWEQAQVTYQQAGNPSGVIGSAINQAKALQALGLNRQARELLQVQVTKLLTQDLDPQLQATGLQNLGVTLRRVGDLNVSRQVLQASLQLSEQLPHPRAKSRALLELGNTERALADRSVAIGHDDTQLLQSALQSYQEAGTTANSPELELQAQLNQFSLLVETGQWPEAIAMYPAIKSVMRGVPPSRTAIYARLNLARSLTCLVHSLDNRAFSCISQVRKEQLEQKGLAPLESPPWQDQDIAQIITTALQEARHLNDWQAESYALGQLGELYEINQQWDDGVRVTQQALLRIESVQAPQIRYRWEWQLGRLFKKQNQLDSAIAAYTTAVDTLESIRGDLLAVDTDIQFSFRDNVEPIYRELVDLLLRDEGTPQQQQKNLEKAVSQIDALQLAELENFLGCNLSQTLQINQNLAQIAQSATFIYPIILDDRLEVIFKLPGQPLKNHSISVSKTEVEQTLRQLRNALPRRDAGTVIANSKRVYDWLIAPLEADLEANSEVDTLVFVLDGDLRNIPMGVLYDRKSDQYLIEKEYALVLLPNTQLFDLSTRPEQLKVLGAGISEPLTVETIEFEPLNATEELETIEQTVASEILINSEFTQANLQQAINSGEFSVVHIATHGNFSSDPEQTYILTYGSEQTKGELLKARELDQLLQQSDRQAATPIELLVLSACQTAEGDNRATLGLAGLAVRSGARSTLATLWQVSDESTIELMEQFYNQLSQPGVTKAQALHHAQQTLLSELRYQNPYYWSAYILVGNWL